MSEAVAPVIAAQAEALKLGQALNQQLSKQIIGWEETVTDLSKHAKSSTTTTKKVSVDGWTILGVLFGVAAWEIATSLGGLFANQPSLLGDLLAIDPFTSWLSIFVTDPKSAGAKPQAKSAMAELDNNLQLLFYQAGSILPGLLQKLQGAPTSSTSTSTRPYPVGGNGHG